MGRGFQGALLRGLGAQDHQATVTGTQWLAPNFLRIAMTSPTLFEDFEVGPAAFLRFWFPDPDGGDTEHQRGYTISVADPARGDFAIDVVLHEPNGPASAWARTAEPGMTIVVTPFSSALFRLADPLPAGYLLIGDAAAIPAINGILAEIPADVAVELYLEQHDQADLLITIQDHPMLHTRWVPRTGPQSLAAAIEARDWSDWSVWATPETGSLKAIRARLKNEFGFPRSVIHAQGYWAEGKGMGTSRTPSDQPAEAAKIAETAQDQQPAAEVDHAPPAPAQVAAKGAWRAQAAGRLLAPLRTTLILAGVVQGIITLIQLTPYVLLVELARRLLQGAGGSELWPIGIWAVVLVAAGALLALALMLWLHAVDARFERHLRERLLGKLSRLPLGWFDARGSAGVKQLVQDDTLSLHYLLTHAVPDAVAAVVAPIAVLAYLFVVEWRLALLMFLPVLAYVVIMYVMIMQSGDKPRRAQQWAEQMGGEAGSYLEGQPVIRVFGGAAGSTFRARLDEYIGFLVAWQRPFVGKKTWMDLVTRPATFVLLISALGTVLVVDGSIDPVTLLPFLLLGTTFGSRLLGIGYGLSGLRDGLTAARRIQVALDEPGLVGLEAGTDPAAAKMIMDSRAPTTEVATGLVEFDRVGFSYRPGAPVIEDVSIVLRPGTVTALVGPSGSGKSTLASLLARFHDVGSGAIRIDGADLRSMTADELYARVGFVFQQTQLVHGTVSDNIALAEPDADRERVEAAARAAQIHDRIVRLPDGYDTILGPDAALSGGERQRLMIARAILADTPILVLDEATAFADPESEYLVQQALNRLTADRTVLVIAHRLHTVTGADQIVVLDHGRAVEIGTHDQLLAAGGRYRRLWLAREGDAVHPAASMDPEVVAR